MNFLGDVMILMALVMLFGVVAVCFVVLVANIYGEVSRIGYKRQAKRESNPLVRSTRDRRIHELEISCEIIPPDLVISPKRAGSAHSRPRMMLSHPVAQELSAFFARPQRMGARLPWVDQIPVEQRVLDLADPPELNTH